MVDYHFHLSLIVLFFCFPIQTMEQELILDTSNKPSTSLLKLLEALNVSHDGFLNSIVAATQNQWLREMGKERWNIPELSLNEADRKKIMALLAEIGCVSDIRPTHTEYDFALILGSTADDMEFRLNYLINCWQNGVRFHQLLFLTGARELDASADDVKILKDTSRIPVKKGWVFEEDQMPKTETDLAHFILRKVQLPKELLRQITISVVSVPIQEDNQGVSHRPTTQDTIVHWMSMKPQSGSILAVSSQPYIGYQDIVLKSYLPHDFSVETVGPAAQPDEKIAVYLDSLARWLYQVNKKHELCN